MREIKFRAWWYDSCADLVGGVYMGKWRLSTVHSLHIGTGRVIVTGGFSSSSRSIPIGDDCVIEQFTGLRDKNGKEIYEGDIIESIDTGDYGSGANIHQTIVQSLNFYINALTQIPDGKVIGNIHENSEFLK